MIFINQIFEFEKNRKLIFGLKSGFLCMTLNFTIQAKDGDSDGSSKETWLNPDISKFFFVLSDNWISTTAGTGGAEATQKL